LSFWNTNLLRGNATAKTMMPTSGMMMRNIHPHEMWPHPKFRSLTAGPFGPGPGAGPGGVGPGGVGPGGVGPGGVGVGPLEHAALVGNPHWYWHVTGSVAVKEFGPTLESHVNSTWIPRFVPSGHASPFCIVICTPFVISVHEGGLMTGVHWESILQPNPPDCVASDSKPAAEQSVPVLVVHILKSI
jgi:hypothetical protein